jgi:hypothetical protein
MNILIGDTGLIGTTLKEKINFDFKFNSKNITTFNDYEYKNATLYLSCLPATKWKVNQNLKEDLENINNIIKIISSKKYNRVILLSTIDVYNDSPIFSDENYSINVKNLSYGSNRYFFELLVKNFIETDDLKIFRLPALFNKHIKKNVLYDLLNNNNINQINKNSYFQWYNLDNLYNDIEKLIISYPNDNLFNLFTEPISTEEIINLFPHYKNNLNTFTNNMIMYDYKTIYNSTGYIKNKTEVLYDIKNFVNETINK